MCQEITIFAKFSYTFVFSILDFDFNFKPEDFELIAFFIFIKYPPFVWERYTTTYMK